MKNRIRTGWHSGAAWMCAIALFALMVAAGPPARAEVSDSAAVASNSGQLEKEAAGMVGRFLLVRYGYALAELFRDPGSQAVIATAAAILALRQPPLDPGSDWPPVGEARTPDPLARREFDETTAIGRGWGRGSERTGSRLVPNAGRRHDGDLDQQRFGAAWTNR